VLINERKTSLGPGVSRAIPFCTPCVKKTKVLLSLSQSADFLASYTMASAASHCAIPKIVESWCVHRVQTSARHALHRVVKTSIHLSQVYWKGLNQCYLPTHTTHFLVGIEIEPYYANWHNHLKNELEGFRQIGSFIVVCEQLIVCVQ
jgi:hypothetical protein